MTSGDRKGQACRLLAPVILSSTCPGPLSRVPGALGLGSMPSQGSAQPTGLQPGLEDPHPAHPGPHWTSHRQGEAAWQPGAQRLSAPGWTIPKGHYLAQKSTLLLLTGHQVSPPEPQLSHQPLQVADVHTAVSFHTCCRQARAGQGLTLERAQGQALLPHHRRDPRKGKRKEAPGSESHQVQKCQGKSDPEPVHMPHSALKVGGRGEAREPGQEASLCVPTVAARMATVMSTGLSSRV